MLLLHNVSLRNSKSFSLQGLDTFDKRGDGIATIYSKKFSCTKVDLVKFSSFEYLALVLKTEPAVLIITIYRPPRHISLFLPEFSELTALIITTYNRIILNGDFNIHINNTADSKALEFLNLLENLELTQHITEATHQQGNKLVSTFDPYSVNCSPDKNDCCP